METSNQKTNSCNQCDEAFLKNSELKETIHWRKIRAHLAIHATTVRRARGVKRNTTTSVHGNFAGTLANYAITLRRTQVNKAAQQRLFMKMSPATIASYAIKPSYQQANKEAQSSHIKQYHYKLHNQLSRMQPSRCAEPISAEGSPNH